MIKVLIPAVLLTGCSMVPSFWDDNESKLAVDVRFAVTQIDCSGEYQAQVGELKIELIYLQCILNHAVRMTLVKLWV